MTGTEYQLLAMRTMNTAYNINQQLTNAALGLCGEAGEFADLLKKASFQGHELDLDHMRKELGDIMWYVALSAEALGTTLDEVMQTNIGKLKARYPEGFNAVKSACRVKGDI